MEKLLERYIKSIEKWKYVCISYFDVDGANCFVEYYTDEFKIYKETKNINVWDMLVFLNVD
jgi:UDP-glucose 4-epimerase